MLGLIRLLLQLLDSLLRREPRPRRTPPVGPIPVPEIEPQPPLAASLDPAPAAPDAASIRYPFAWPTGELCALVMGSRGEAVAPRAAFEEVADRLNCKLAAILAVYAVEAGSALWDAQGRPKMLFEPHKFSENTNHRHDAEHPEISDRHWVEKWSKNLVTYPEGDVNWRKLQTAYELDASAALQSASWGAFQIMGSHYKRLGYASVEDFVRDMGKDAQSNLTAFERFINSDSDLLQALQRLDWKSFARRYNGPKNVEVYSGRIHMAFQRQLAAAEKGMV